jgi:hypothetical protein
MADTLVTQDMIARKGVWGSARISPPVAESDIRKWAIATYWPEKPPAIYWDTEYAAGTRHGKIVAPPDFNPFAWPVDRPRAAPATPTTQSAPTRRTTNLNGGQTDTFGKPMYPGDVISSRSRLKNWEERQGRMGLMLYVFSELEWKNQHGELVRNRISTSIRY